MTASDRNSSSSLATVCVLVHSPLDNLRCDVVLAPNSDESALLQGVPAGMHACARVHAAGYRSHTRSTRVLIPAHRACCQIPCLAPHCSLHTYLFLSAISDEFYDVYSDAYYDTGTP
jgi:hypothetical protein